MKPQIKTNLFDLSKEEEAASRMIYDGKIIKCLVAPYHTYEELEKIIPYTKNTYLFPERSVPSNRLSQLVATIAKNPSNEEFRIITTSQMIIIDMVGECVRVLTQDGRIVPSPIKTFMANIHDIRYSLLENEDHQKSRKKDSLNDNKISELLYEIRKTKSPMKDDVRKAFQTRIDMIGEEIVRKIITNELQKK